MYNINSCVICNYPLTDPVCRDCYLKQIEILLNDVKVHDLAKEIILKKIQRKFPIETLNDTQCILCNNFNVELCRYCISVIISNTLRDFNFTDETIENFGFNPLFEEYSLEEQKVRLPSYRTSELDRKQDDEWIEDEWQ